jgi:WD40 repeat protein
VGNSGGGVTIWDVPELKRRSRCPGANCDIYALAFSPDGSLLAGAGRRPALVWDAASGLPCLWYRDRPWQDAVEAL